MNRESPSGGQRKIPCQWFGMSDQPKLSSRCLRMAAARSMSNST